MTDLSHLDAQGRARMVDVGDKEETERRARAEALVTMSAGTLAAIEGGGVPKGDVIAVARLAGITAAKRTHELIPLCHQLSLSFVDVQIEADRSLPGLRVSSEARLRGRTGVEMEALVAVSVAALTVYDMCKAIDRGMEMSALHLLEKSGGRSGTWKRGGAVSAAPHQSAATVVSVNVAAEKGVRKQPRDTITLVAEHGVEGDGHAGAWHRQVSLLAEESIERMRAQGLDVHPGDFGENVTTRGMIVHELPVGARLALGEALIEVTQIGKVCHDRCAIFYQAGDCVMPREGIFARVLQGGCLRAGDRLEVLS